MNSVADVFRAFGNSQNVADLLGVSAQATTNMKSRGAIPSRHWAKLVEAARTKKIEGITFEALAAIRPVGHPPSAQASAA